MPTRTYMRQLKNSHHQQPPNEMALVIGNFYIFCEIEYFYSFIITSTFVFVAFLNGSLIFITTSLILLLKLVLVLIKSILYFFFFLVPF